MLNGSVIADLSEAKEWNPHHIIAGENPFALLILNQPIENEERNFLTRSWKSALLHIAVDGGANQLKKGLGEEYLPEIVCGDFDSINPDVLKFYRDQGAVVIPTPCQDETDFTKAVRLTEEHLNQRNIEVSSIVALSRNGDRLDHILGNLNTLYEATKITTQPVFIFGNGTLTWLLSEGHHKIHIADCMMESHVGLIPLGQECTDVSTTGLKWNLCHGKMNFGGLISSCNKFDGSNVVTVTTDTPLIWTMECGSFTT